MNNIYKAFSLLFLIISFVYSSKATHVAGADITYECLGNDQYVVTLNVFRDCSGSTLGTTNTLDFISTCGGSFTATLDQVSVNEVSQLCPSALPQSDCGSAGFPGMEQYVYQDTVTIAPACDTWTISWDLCCRNDDISNLANPGGEEMYVESTLNSLTAPCNSSPYFTAQPIPYVCVNQQVTYNFGVVENDGDSLSFSIVSALNNVPSNIPYNFPYTGASPTPYVVPADSLTLNPATGLLTFTPTSLGIYVVVIQVDEYDNSDPLNPVLIGSVMRDIQVVVENCTNNVPDPTTGAISNLTGLATQLNNNTIELCDGSSFSFDISIADVDGLDSISLASNISQVFPGATFTPNGGNPATATIEWTAIGGNSFFNSFVVYANDNACPVPGIQTYVYTVIINQSTVASEDVIVICGQQSADISVLGGDNFVWTDMAGGDPINIGVNFECDTCDVTWALPDSTTSYIVTSDLATIGCSNIDTVVVSVVQDFGYTMAQPDTFVCLFGDCKFIVSPDTAGNFLYDWTPAAFFVDGNLTDSVAEGNVLLPDTSDVIFTVTSDWGCVKTDTFMIVASLNVQPIISILGDTTICIGDSTQLVAVNAVSYECDYTLEMFDSFGDGWNGAALDVFTNGVLDTSLTFITGVAETAIFPVSSGDTIEIVFTSGGFPSEESYILYDGEGNIILQDGPSPTNGSVYTGLVNCGLNGGAITYSWTPAGTWLSQDGLTNPYAIPSFDTTYTVVALDTIGGCSDTASIDVYLVPTFGNVLTQTDNAICLLDSVTFNVTPDVADTYTYEWSPASLFPNNTIANPTGGFTNSGNNSPQVSITNSFGCSKIENFVVTVSNNVAPLLEVSGDSTICAGDSSQIFANVVNTGVGIIDDFEGGIGAGWQTINNGISSPACGSNNGTDGLFFDGPVPREAITNAINVQSGGTIDFCMFVGNDVLGSFTCENADLGEDIELSYSVDGGANWVNIQIFLQSEWDATGSSPNAWQCYSIPIPAAAQTNATIFMWNQPSPSACTGCDSWSIDDVAITPIGGNYQYAWTPTATINDSTLANPWVTPTQLSTTYFVLAYDTIGGCSDVDSVTVSMVNSFNVATFLSDTAICLYEEFEMSVTPPADTTYTYTWSPSAYLSSVTDSAVIADTVATSGWLEYIVETANPFGCQRTDTFRVQVSEGAQPILTIAGDSTMCQADTTTLFTVFNASTPITCQYCFNMYDDFGDGWNDSYAQLWLDGVLLQDSLFAQNPWGNGDSAVDICFDIAEGSNIEVVFVPVGPFDTEISYYFGQDLLGSVGSDTLFSDGLNGTAPAGGSVYTTIASCGSDAFPSLAFDWSPTTSLLNPDSNITNAYPSGDQSYTLIGLDTIGGCGDTAYYNVYVVPSFEPSVTASDSVICLLENVVFDINVTPTPTTTYTYDWEFSSYLASNSGSTNTASNIDVPGDLTFNYTVSSPEDCNKIGTASVFVSTGIQPEISAVDDTICEGNTISLNPTLVGLSLTADSCELTLEMFDSFGDGWGGASFDIIINGAITDSHTLLNGLDSTLTFSVGVTDEICVNYSDGAFPDEVTYVLSLGSQILLSDGFNVDGLAPDQGQVWCAVQVCGLNDATYAYDWSPSSSLTSDNTKFTVASPESSTTYQIIVTDTIGYCADTAEIDITVIEIPQPSVSSPGSFCENQPPINLQTLVDIQGGTWSGSGIVDPVLGTFNPNDGIIGLNTINYTVTILGCTGDTTFNIPINIIPDAPSALTNSPYCQATLISNVIGNGSGGLLTWYEYNQITSIDTGTTPNLGIAGESDTLYVNETLNGCTSPFTAVAIEVIPQPNVSFTGNNAPDSTQGLIPMDVILSNSSDDGLSYVWNFGNGTASGVQDPGTIIYNSTGDYIIILVGTDSNGCQNSDTLLVDADDVTFIPIVFSPTGDGINEVFKVTGFPEDDFLCVIYNRWGVKLYEYTDPINGYWDGGTHPDGTYFALITYTDWGGEEKSFEGAITLLRKAR